MTERERLIELIDTPNKASKIRHGNPIESERPSEILADYLLESGVIVPPCNVGDVVYADSRIIMNRESNGIIACSVISISKNRKHTLVKIAPVYSRRSGSRYNLRVPVSAFGKTVFLTQEEAEKALEEREKE